MSGMLAEPSSSILVGIYHLQNRVCQHIDGCMMEAYLWWFENRVEQCNETQRQNRLCPAWRNLRQY